VDDAGPASKNNRNLHKEEPFEDGNAVNNI
jgi:hypothetical protein